MRFLVDAHLPPSLCTLLEKAGHDAIHTSALPSANRTPDQSINEVSVRDQRIVITKDTDFYHSHLLYQRPWKLLLIRTGNISLRELKELIETHLNEITKALENFTLVELDRTGLSE